MSRRKVLFLAESLSGGGAEKVLSVLVKHINKKCFDLTVCTVSDTGIYCEEIKQNVRYCSILGNAQDKSAIGKIIYKIKYKAIYNILPMWLIYKIFVPKGYDVEVAFMEGYVTKLLSASTNKRSLKIAWVHTDLLKNPWTQNIKVFNNESKELICYAKFDKIVCVSDTAKENFIKKFGLKNVIRIYNPIDKDEILRKADIPCEYPQSENCFKLITIGRLVPQKGYDRLLRVMKKIKEDGLKCNLLILGDGEMRVQLSNYIKKNNLSDSVILGGFKKNPYKYLRKADCFVCSSRSEGFSLVIAEAMMLGIPVISTYCSGPNELLEDGKYGLLVDNNEEDLYRGIKSIIEDEKLRMYYKQQAIIGGEQINLRKAMQQIELLIS